MSEIQKISDTVKYRTKVAVNVTTGRPFEFDVNPNFEAKLKQFLEYVENGMSYFHGTRDEAILHKELTLFGGYHELLKIFFENGYTPQLHKSILLEFGCTETLAEEMIHDEVYVESVKGWFEGITCDGERALRTMQILYGSAALYVPKSRRSQSALPEPPAQIEANSTGEIAI